ncbi:MAG: hypothetical protein P4L99_21730 [Chthoniobacter sp.]|nr:hypothetical protein [Chthoniobacter sp.]
MIDATELRQQVRAVLSIRAEDQTLAEGYILAALQRFFPEKVKASEMQLALQWNKARGWVEDRWNGDEERTEWLLTERGRIKEGVK